MAGGGWVAAWTAKTVRRYVDAAIFQLVSAGLSGSVALAADTIHNFSDALTGIPLWIAFALGRKAATKRYTSGLGRAEDLAGEDSLAT